MFPFLNPYSPTHRTVHVELDHLGYCKQEFHPYPLYSVSEFVVL
jgi:hypothetical protein